MLKERMSQFIKKNGRIEKARHINAKPYSRSKNKINKNEIYYRDLDS